jgi:hypothetical protein
MLNGVILLLVINWETVIICIQIIQRSKYSFIVQFSKKIILYENKYTIYFLSANNHFFCVLE